MKPILIIAGVVLIAVFIASLAYNKFLQTITNVYKDVSEKEGGEVETGGLSLRPRLKLWYKGTPVVISHAYTGTLSAKPGYYTFAQFWDLPRPKFRFRIVPTKRLDQLEKELMRHKMETGIQELDSAFTISSNHPEKMKSILTADVVDTLLEWLRVSTDNGIEDIHNYEDKLVFSIYGVPQEHAVYHQLLDSAKLLLQAYLDVVISPDQKKTAVGC